MKILKIAQHTALGVGIFFIGQTSGTAASYEFATVDYQNALNTALVGVNSSGRIVGLEWQESFPPQSSFIINNGIFGSAFQYPSANYTHAFGIDNAGNVLGSYVIETMQQFAQGGFLRAVDGTFIGLPPAAAYTAISGNGNMADGTDNGLRLDVNNTVTSIVVPQSGMGGVDAEGIDNSGNVVYFFNGGGPSVFRDSQGSYQTIYVPGSVYTEVQGLNNRGEIVGFYLEDDMFHGFLWKGGSDYTTIDFPGAQYTVLSGINDDGTIVGFYAFPDSAADHGLVVTPISTPELSSAPMVGIALVFFATSMLGKRPRHL